MIQLDGDRLTLEEVWRVAHGEKVKVTAAALARVQASNDLVQRLIDQDRVVYGITTGFGHLCNTRIGRADLERLQSNLVRSHATGVGPAFSRPEVRAAITIRINSLLKGKSGVRPAVIHGLVALLNKDIVPRVPQQGSVGSSGDLAPLSHIMLVLMGEGEVLGRKGQRLPAGSELARVQLKPLQLHAKEGLALINGTAMMTGVLALAIYRAMDLARSADVVAALTLEVVKGSDAPFDPEFIALRPYLGMQQVAANIRACVSDSEVRLSHADCTRVQDAYSLRCIPQVHGATRETLNHLADQVTIEINSVTDNPILLSEDKIISGGHFHGQPMAFVGDFFGIAVAELANISERRIDRLLNPLINNTMPFLAQEPGVNSGLMIIQYTAAALVSENKVLAHPASVDSIPTSAYQEDHVSMGTIAARKGAKILEHTAQVLAIEWLSAAQAYEFVKPLGLGKGSAIAYALLREKVAPLLEDRILAPDLEVACKLLWDCELVRRVAPHVTII